MPHKFKRAHANASKFAEKSREHPAFEHEIQKEGIIESLPSKLKEVYNQYLSILEDGQPDIVQDNSSDQRMSEKSLIDYMQRRINGVD